MALEHSPFPWTAHVQDAWPQDGKTYRQWTVRDAEKQDIATVFYVNDKGAGDAAILGAASQLLQATQRAYSLLAAIDHHWPGRHSMNGQTFLNELLDAITAATGADRQDTQDAASVPLARKEAP